MSRTLYEGQMVVMLIIENGPKGHFSPHWYFADEDASIRTNIEIIPCKGKGDGKKFRTTKRIRRPRR